MSPPRREHTRQPDARRTLTQRLTRVVGALLGGEPNDSPSPYQNEAIEALIGRVWSLRDDDLQLLGEAWDREDSALRRHAWEKARDVIADRKHDATLDYVRREVAAWALARRSDFRGVEGVLGGAGAPAGGRQAAAPAIVDKAVAILAGDRLDEAERGVLDRPWDSLSSNPGMVKRSAPPR